MPFPKSGNECDLILDASKQKINFRERQATNGGYDRRGITCDLVEFAPQWVRDAVSGFFDLICLDLIHSIHRNPIFLAFRDYRYSATTGRLNPTNLPCDIHVH